MSVGAGAGGNLPLSLIVLALSHVVLGGTATVTSDHLSSPFNKLVYIYPLYPSCWSRSSETCNLTQDRLLQYFWGFALSSLSLLANLAQTRDWPVLSWMRPSSEGSKWDAISCLRSRLLDIARALPPGPADYISHQTSCAAALSCACACP